MHRFTSVIKVAKLSISCLEQNLMYFPCGKFAKVFQHTGTLKVRALYQKNIEVYFGGM